MSRHHEVNIFQLIFFSLWERNLQLPAILVLGILPLAIVNLIQPDNYVGLFYLFIYLFFCCLFSPLSLVTGENIFFKIQK